MSYFANHFKRPPTTRASAGFTIIEVMIVLAIAGLILLIVFEALPALERSSRNNQRRQDVQTILATVSHYELNNSGNIPSSGSNFLQYSKLTSYDKTQVKYIPPDAPTASGVNVYAETASNMPASEQNTNLDVVSVYNYRKCSTTSPGASTNGGAGYSDIIALYAIESGSAAAPQCQQL
jgi:prepilin-type N-terminal cleavage/methylation domain-containing protein